MNISLHQTSWWKGRREEAEEVPKEGKCGIFNKERDNWTLVSEHPEQSARGSLLVLVLNPENIFHAGGGQYQGLCLKGPHPSAKGRQLGEGLFQGLTLCC